MCRAAIVLLGLLVPSIQSFTAFTATNGVSHRAPRSSKLCMGGAHGQTTTRAGKTLIIDSVKKDLEASMMVFAVPSKELKVNQITDMRKKLPATTKARVVKNTLLREAAKAYPQWQELVGESMTKGENMWFFVGDDMTESLKIAKEFAKDAGKKDTHMPKYGVLEGKALDAEAVEILSNLPSKQELIRRVAVGIRLVPTKLARGLKQVPTKLARGVKLALVPEDSEEASEGATQEEEPAAE